MNAPHFATSPTNHIRKPVLTNSAMKLCVVFRPAQAPAETVIPNACVPFELRTQTVEAGGNELDGS